MHQGHFSPRNPKAYGPRSPDSRRRPNDFRVSIADRTSSGIPPVLVGSLRVRPGGKRSRSATALGAGKSPEEDPRSGGKVQRPGEGCLSGSLSSHDCTDPALDARLGCRRAVDYLDQECVPYGPEYTPHGPFLVPTTSYSGVTYAPERPPSTRKVEALTYEASSEARKRTAAAISLASANRPIGRCTSLRSACSGSLEKSS
jgi:hypothetical protein